MVIQSSMSYFPFSSQQVAPWPLLENFQRRGLFCFLQLESSISTQLKLLESSYEPVPSVLESLWLAADLPLIVGKLNSHHLWSFLKYLQRFPGSFYTLQIFLSSRKKFLHDLLIVPPIMWLPCLLTFFSFSSEHLPVF